MDTTDIVVTTILLLAIIINLVLQNVNIRLYKRKSRIIDDKIEYINKVYVPALTIIMRYYVDKEDYGNAQKCKDLIDNVFKN